MKPPRPPSHPPVQAMGIGALAAAAAHLLTRASGLIRDMVFVAYFGASGAADAYFAAFRVPHLFRELLAEGTLSNVFVPLFAETTQKESLKNAWRLANALLGILLLILGVLTLLIFHDRVGRTTGCRLTT